MGVIYIKGIIYLLTLLILLSRVSAKNTAHDSEAFIKNEDMTENRQTDMITQAIWLSQFDMTGFYTKNGVQRPRDEFAALVADMLCRLKSDGYDSIFLQMHPNGDSMYQSDYYPVSKYVTGAYGRKLEYDPIEIFMHFASQNGIAVHAWINPYRLMTVDEVQSVDERFAVRTWYDKNSRNVAVVDGRLYALPSSDEALGLLVDFVREMLARYDFAGLHIDDYFYPTADADFDKYDFFDSEYTDIADFRRHCTDKLVATLYQTVKSVDQNLLFGVSPAGNIYSLYDGYYIDVKKWCCKDGYIDYICPQLYFGFLNKYCPFEKIFADWRETAGGKRLIIGLSAAKALAGKNGQIDAFAGTEEGKNEWINDSGIIERQKVIVREYDCGIALFSLGSLYDGLPD